MSRWQHFSGVAVRIFILMAFVVSTFLQPGMLKTQAGYNPTFAWSYEYDFETSMTTPGYFDMELDASGYPHVAYYNDTSDGLVYRYFDGTDWQTGLEKFGFYDYISLELDSGGNPHISYFSTISMIVAYTYYDGAAWHDIRITPGQQSSGQFAALALTDGGVPLVAYYNPYSFNLSIARLVGSNFVISEVEHADPSTNAFSFISMEVDANDHPHLAYCYGATVGMCDKLHYAAFNGTTWTIEEVDTSAGAGYYASLALDSAGYPHISYHVNAASLKYAYKDADGWHSQVVESGNTGKYSALVLDANDQPAIAYYSQVSGKLKYTYWDGSTWAMNMNPDAYQGIYGNLELDAADNPQLVYWDYYNNMIMLAKYQPMADLALTQMWVDEVDSQLLATVRNDGAGEYEGDLEVEMWVDDVYQNSYWSDTPTIAPGEILTVGLPEPSACTTPPSMEVKVCLNPYSPDANGENNCLIETWPCEVSPLTISNFAISEVTTSSFKATWTTNRPADSVLIYTSANGRPGVPYADSNDVLAHTAVITGLNLHQIYYVNAISTDAGGLLVKSNRKTVQTLAFPGEVQPPNVTIERSNTREEVYQFKAQYTDTSNIQMVHFYMDDVLIGTDYTPNNGVYEMPMAPARRGYTRDVFYQSSHDVVVEAVNYAGNLYMANPELFAPLRENFPIESELITPAAESTVMIPGTTAPAGTTQEIKVFARQFEWECDYADGGMPECGDVARPVNLVRFFVNDDLLATVNTPDADGMYSAIWNMASKPVGVYTLKAVVFATDGGTQEHTATLRIAQGQPDLDLLRVVSRYDPDSYFRVRLTVSNSEEATGAVEITSIQENFKGFQPVNQTTLDPSFGQWSVTASSALQGKQGTATITLEEPWELAPGESMIFNYYVVPILFPDMSTAVYKMGSPQSKVFYLDAAGVAKTKGISAPNLVVYDRGSTLINNSVAYAMEDSDYLIITAPSRLTELYNITQVHKLMGDMAWLAMLKKGVLAYWDPNLDKEVLNDLLHDNSDWTNRLHPNFETRFNGYVLLVGESEVISSYTTGPYELYWSGTDGGENYYVHYSDNHYAHTDGNGAPDLLLGRIIGNSAAKLDQAILNSIDTHFYSSYEREQAFVGSGVGGSESTMQGDANTVTNTLIADGYTVSKHHWEEEAFLNMMPGIPFGAHDGLAHGDVDGDGTEEIIWARDETNQVFAIKINNGAIVGAWGLDFEHGDSLAAGDVNDDGLMEVIIGDRNDTIRTYNMAGSQIASFNREFSAWEQVAVGDVLSSNDGDEIVMADDNDYLRIFSSTGANLGVIDIGALGYDFADYDILHVGNIDWNNTSGLDEIVFTDRTHDKIVGVAADGTVVRTLNVDFDYGDNMVLANVTSDDLDDIIIADQSDVINTYTYLGGDNSVHSTHVDVEEYDGLVMVSVNVEGILTDRVIHADRGNSFRVVDMEYPANAIQQFEDNISGADLIWFQAHGWAGGMDPAIHVDNFPVDFGGAHPIVNAWSCTTGDYEGYGDNGIAEAFLKSGAGVYIGSTEVSPVSKNSNTSRKYYRDYWEPGKDAAESFARFKNDRWEVSEYYDWWWYLINEYNFYGDPKFDIMGSTTLQSQPTLQRLEPQSVVEINLPMYTVEPMDGIDYVEILADADLGTHDGDLFQDQNEYQVPLYVHTIEIPAGQQVQNVTLTSRENMTYAYDMNLPLVDMLLSTSEVSPVRSALSQAVLSSTPGHDWSPAFEEPFTWSVYDNIDGGSTLTLTLHPFYYDPAARYSEYYQNFVFNVETISSEVQITRAETNQPVYHPGDDVLLSLQVENNGEEPLDAVVNTTLRKIGSGEAVDGFELTALKELEDVGDIELVWTWLDPNIPAGMYTIEIVVEDMLGQRLAERSLEISLGETAGEVTSFSVSPRIFQPGDIVDATLTFANTGDLPVDGIVTIEVQTLAGDVVVTFVQEFVDLPAGASETIPVGWDSTGALETDYRFVGYVNYDSTITEPMTAEISTQAKVYLPMVKR